MGFILESKELFCLREMGECRISKRITKKLEVYIISTPRLINLNVSWIYCVKEMVNECEEGGSKNAPENTSLIRYIARTVY